MNNTFSATVQTKSGEKLEVVLPMSTEKRGCYSASIKSVKAGIVMDHCKKHDISVVCFWVN